MCLPISFRTKDSSQRKYIDLLKESSAKLPNWDPPKNIRAGDFGTIDKEMGGLIVEGNIYTHEDIAYIAGQYPAIEEEEVDPYIIKSYGVQELEVKPDDGISQGVIMRGQWQFNKKRGAILIMCSPRSTHVPDDFFIASHHPRVLENKCIVYQVWNCPGYYMYLSSKSSEKVGVTLSQDLGKRTSPNVTINPSATIRWVSDGGIGVRQHAYGPDAVYTPLYCMKPLRKPLLKNKFRWHGTDVPKTMKILNGCSLGCGGFLSV